MGKIPVGKTIADAYGFAFGKFLPNLGTTWLPVALAMAAAWFLLMPYFTAMGGAFQNLQGLKPDDPAAMAAIAGVSNAYRFVLLFQIFDLAMRSQIMLGLTRRVFGEKQMLPFVFFEFGAPFWRLFGAYAIVTIILMVVYSIGAIVVGLGIGILVGIAAFVFGSLGASAAGVALAVLATFALVIALIPLVLYPVVRMTFLLAPAIVAENNLAIFRSWELTKGNFWRSFWVGVVVFLPVILLLHVFLLAFYGSEFSPVFHLLSLGHKPDPGGDESRDADVADGNADHGAPALVCPELR